MKDEKHESRRGAKPGWRGQWYIYNTRTREFLRRVSTLGQRCPQNPGGIYVRWTPGITLAMAYKNPSTAQKTANRINREAYPDQNPRVATVVTVVTGEAAKCLDMINRRGTSSVSADALPPSPKGKAKRND